MSTAHITLHDYEAAERAMAHDIGTTGVVVHGIITLLVVAGLIATNVTLAPESRGRRSPSAAMSVGRLAHCRFGYVQARGPAHQAAAADRSPRRTDAVAAPGGVHPVSRRWTRPERHVPGPTAASGKR
jgi:hypothetical protein